MKRMIIVGGGTAGWMSALFIQKSFKDRQIPCEVLLLESPQIPIIGVGEGTTDDFLQFLITLDVDLLEFVRETDASYKLGILFKGWKEEKENEYLNPIYGRALDMELMKEFSKRWKGPLTDLSLASHLIKKNGSPYSSKAPPQHVSYGFHFDAPKVADYLGRVAVQRGVQHIRKEMKDINYSPTGDIKSLHLLTGEVLSGDFFVDCSGFRSALIGKFPEAGWRSFLDDLPCDRAVVTPTMFSQDKSELVPYTSAVAMKGGWRWQIPVHSRLGNGYVYSSAFLSEEEARTEFLNELGLPLDTKTRLLTFRPGYQTKGWIRNCLSLGLAAGFLEPLEATSLGLTIATLNRFNDLYFSEENDEKKRELFNSKMTGHYEQLKDFIFAHYFYTGKNDTPFWRAMTQRELPESLKMRLEKLFTYYNGQIDFTDDLRNLLSPIPAIGWLSVLDGLGEMNIHKTGGVSKVTKDYIRRLELNSLDHITLPDMLGWLHSP